MSCQLTLNKLSFPEARFAEDLDADSLDLVELVMELEEEFDITVEEEELQDLPTIGDASKLVSSKLAMKIRIAITGVGVVSSAGIGKGRHLESHYFNGVPKNGFLS